MGILYSSGKGDLERDPREAHYWLSAAVLDGFEAAQRHLDALERRIQPDQLAGIRRASERRRQQEAKQNS